MADLAIQAAGLGKRYRIGARSAPYRTLRDTLAGSLASPLRGLRGLRGLRAGRAAPPAIWALRDVSCTIAHGEVVGVIGRNGAGKSTLLKILARITEPTEGYADIAGRVGSLLEVGTGFHAELTGRENVYLNGAILGMRRAEIARKFDEIVAFAEVERFIDTPVKHYSSGMYLRLAFAVAAFLEPEILLVDEVLAVGDLQFQKKCLGQMQAVSRAGRTVLFVSHNLSAIVGLCPRALLLHEGRLVADGPAAEVVAEYLASAAGASASVTWDDPARSPARDGFRLTEVSLTDAAGRPLSVADVEQPLQLHIGYELSTPLKFRCYADFWTRGVCAFPALEPVEILRERPGRYRSTLLLPGNLLAEGDYTVNVSIFASRGKKAHLAQVKDVIAFQVFDRLTGGSARGDYREGLLGVARPKLDWQLTYGEPAGPAGGGGAGPDGALESAARPAGPSAEERP
jgi:lipopolysaccharide transport system ATP-binding protein